MFNEVNQELNKGYNTNRQIIATYCINKLLELDMIEPVLQIIEWAVTVLKTVNNSSNQTKLLLVGNLLETCVMTPILFVSQLLQGLHIKWPENLRNQLPPDELSADIAIAKLKLLNMNKLVHPCAKFFF